jgi:hypothetical protein
MYINESLIRRLIASADMDTIWQNKLFLQNVLNRPGAAEFLLELMRKETGETASSAHRMLCQFDMSALPIIAQALSYRNVEWRNQLLDVIWAIVSVEEPRDRAEALKGIFLQIEPLLSDRTIIAVEPELPIEIEYEYRICDEVYALYQRLLVEDFDESLFRAMEFHERDVEIRVFRSRMTPLVS